MYSPKFRKIGVRGAYVAFTDLSLVRRVTRGWDMGPLRTGATLRTTGTVSLAASTRLGAELNPAFLGKFAASAMEPGSLTLSFRHTVSLPRFPRHPPGDPQPQART
ncbi:MAG: hypothetical protein LBT40_13655 [Deltaproteobacteria bacterium]|nr:hypothetical protein [Deltaproteobacteria bacterium]